MIEGNGFRNLFSLLTFLFTYVLVTFLRSLACLLACTVGQTGCLQETKKMPLLLTLFVLYNCGEDRKLPD